MGEFFKGWRRKAGCILLAFATAVTGVWVRSHIWAEVVSNDWPDSWCLMIGGGQFEWSRTTIKFTGDDVPMCGGIWYGRTWETKPYRAEDFQLGAKYQYLEWFSLPGATFATASLTKKFDTIGLPRMAITSTVSFWKVSLLWLMLPLTFLSAYLILWKPGKAK